MASQGQKIKHMLGQCWNPTENQRQWSRPVSSVSSIHVHTTLILVTSECGDPHTRKNSMREEGLLCLRVGELQVTFQRWQVAEAVGSIQAEGRLGADREAADRAGGHEAGNSQSWAPDLRTALPQDPQREIQEPVELIPDSKHNTLVSIAYSLPENPDIRGEIDVVTCIQTAWSKNISLLW